MKFTASLFAAAVLLAIGGYWYWSPHLAIHFARQAAATGDPDRLARYVDMDLVRANLADRLAAHGAIQVDRALRAAISPQALAAIVAAGQPVDTVSSAGPATWAIERPDVDLVLASPDFQEGMPPQSRVRFVFSRTGFATWRLTEIRMPGMR